MTTETMMNDFQAQLVKWANNTDWAQKYGVAFEMVEGRLTVHHPGGGILRFGERGEVRERTGAFADVRAADDPTRLADDLARWALGAWANALVRYEALINTNELKELVGAQAALIARLRAELDDIDVVLGGVTGMPRVRTMSRQDRILALRTGSPSALFDPVLVATEHDWNKTIPRGVEVAHMNRRHRFVHESMLTELQANVRQMLDGATPRVRREGTTPEVGIGQVMRILYAWDQFRDAIHDDAKTVADLRALFDQMDG